MTAPPLVARKLAWSIGAHYILLDLDLEVRAGALTVLRGDNGSGKTTLLHLLAGRTAPSGGSVELHGRALSELDPGYIGGQIGWLGHKPGLYLDLSARENIDLFAAVAESKLITENPGFAAETLLEFGLLPADHDRPVRAFSRGMQQRTGLARVAVSPATVWLLDEPTTGLDARGRAVLTEKLRAAADRGIAVLAASHDDALSASADRVVELGGGRIALDSAPGGER